MAIAKFNRPQHGQQPFALRVLGNSMVNAHGWPSYPAGTVIVVDPGKEPHTGSRVVVSLGMKDECMFAQYIEDGGRAYLKWFDPGRPALDISDMPCVLHGTVIQSITEEDAA